MTAEPVLLRLPRDFLDDEPATDAPSATVLPRLRGIDLSGIVNIAVDSSIVTTGLVTIAVARNDLGVLGEHVMRRLSGRVGSRNHGVSVRFSLDGRDTHISVKAENPGQDFMDAVLYLAEVARESASQITAGGT